MNFDIFKQNVDKLVRGITERKAQLGLFFLTSAAVAGSVKGGSGPAMPV